MKVSSLPEDLVNIIYSYLEGTYIENNKKLIRTIVFLKYKYDFDIYFNQTELSFYKYALLNNN